MKILIGYSMRSGSTLLQHILNQHSQIRSFSDLSSNLALVRILLQRHPEGNYCMKPMDLVFLGKRCPLLRYFDKFIWISRDPRDSYLSSLESGYAYLFWLPGRKEHGIDVGLLRRWKRIYRHFFRERERWHWIRYEDLVSDPDRTLAGLLDYLELPHETLLPFSRFNLANGGDHKLRHTRTVKAKSVARYRKEMSQLQQQIFKKHLGREMEQLGYL